jgi:hypothetical protein
MNSSADNAALLQFLDSYAESDTAIQQLHSQLASAVDLSTRFSLYQAAIPLIEKQIWSNNAEASLITLYHRIAKEMELITQQLNQEQYNFVVIIPIADRPQHLQSCLQSLLELCQAFYYGGEEYSSEKSGEKSSEKSSHYKRIRVIVADDSKFSEKIKQHQQLANDFTTQGLITDHFDQQQQWDLFQTLSKTQQTELVRILGQLDRDHFYHKGASIMRNLTYLRLQQMTSQTTDKQLFYFIDSDQEFKVITAVRGSGEALPAINYFYHLNQIFGQTDVSILTGKVVGDPPVSPSVMAGNFLDDVNYFLQQVSENELDNECSFHQESQQPGGDAAYHDMADLFGFAPAAQQESYRCTLKGEHDNTKCLMDFSHKLNHFFDGEHPTRVTWYEHEDVMLNVQPARTIYTGNYVLSAEALEWFIPFATLRLRMAGPTLGRLLKAEMGRRFVSANLPMLHKRTVAELGQSEYRPGVDRKAENVDLSGEFERQFFGDVMLFSTIKLCESGYPSQTPNQQELREIVLATATKLRDQYAQKQYQIILRIERLKLFVEDNKYSWNQRADLQQARGNIQQFLNNMEHNFGQHSRCYSQVDDQENKQQWLDKIIASIGYYKDDRQAWLQLMNKNN